MKDRILPAFYSNNYLSVPPDAERKLLVEYVPKDKQEVMIQINGWNSSHQYIGIEP